jgi:hypothetical protein
MHLPCNWLAPGFPHAFPTLYTPLLRRLAAESAQCLVRPARFNLPHFTPRRGIGAALELGHGLVQQPLFFRRRANPLQEATLLKLAEPLEDLRSFFGFELRQFDKDFGFAHGCDLPGGRNVGKPPPQYGDCGLQPLAWHDPESGLAFDLACAAIEGLAAGAIVSSGLLPNILGRT